MRKFHDKGGKGWKNEEGKAGRTRLEERNIDWVWLLSTQNFPEQASVSVAAFRAVATVSSFFVYFSLEFSSTAHQHPKFGNTKSTKPKKKKTEKKLKPKR